MKTKEVLISASKLTELACTRAEELIEAGGKNLRNYNSRLSNIDEGGITVKIIEDRSNYPDSFQYYITLEMLDIPDEEWQARIQSLKDELTALKLSEKERLEKAELLWKTKEFERLKKELGIS